ncbi:hypothetical protein QMK19_18105 [Streptomyces sp. H10-C2]|uniref:hypothetical protein n=1 Tax=unclassified Streptomyces TaxID=2593676 RepID=UPI0024BB5172|nr:MULTISPECIES: hypothetical protein [unclassified Streptomyces]MDJ0343466.1 hypothetical protein [Streptomyces sp. PH10-H1]MDJ0371546.1 hypothetical protein [Streptomyces sp. H10-C2]
MADFSYNPKFHHAVWEDRISLVQADGPNGFNIRFGTIESDLHGVATVVDQIGTELDALSARVPPRPPTVTLSLAPTLQAVAGQPSWVLQTSGAAVAPSGGGPNGVLPLVLPDHAQVTAVRVVGHGVPPSGQNTVFSFTRVSLTDGAVQSTLFDTSGVPLNTSTSLPNPAIGLINLANFRYLFSAGSGQASGDPVTLVAFQFTYTNP